MADTDERGRRARLNRRPRIRPSVTRCLKIGAGAGYGGDRIEPAEELAAVPDLDFLVFECLAERTLALAQRARLEDGSAGYNPLLEARMERVLEPCRENGITVISNMGAANPRAAAERTADVARDLGLDVRVAAVFGSDVREELDDLDGSTVEGTAVEGYRDRVVSANAYLGVEGILDALDGDADVVLTDRVSDVSLFLAPMLHEFDDWSHAPLDPPDAVGQGIVAAHLVECAGQVTGGYFADPGYKDVPELADLGFPIVEVDESGGVVVTKPDDTGGEVTTRTCTEQLLYEVHDPSEYITPDAVADFSAVEFEQVGPDRVRVTGASAHTRTDTLKLNICYEDSIVGEGQISYGGPGALDRAELAGEVVRERLDRRGVDPAELRVDHVGVDSLHGSLGRKRGGDPYEVRLRVAGRCETETEAEGIGREVETLYTNGPAGGGGVERRTEPIFGIVSMLVDRDEVSHEVDFFDARREEAP